MNVIKESKKKKFWSPDLRPETVLAGKIGSLSFF